MIEINMVRRSLSLVVIALVAQLALTFSPIVQQTATAATEHPQDTLERWLYYRGMRACLEHGLTSNSELSREDVLKGKWNPVSDKEGFGYLAPDMDGNDDNDGTVKCDDGSIWVRGATIFGFDDSVELLCAINRGLQKAGDGSRLTPNNSDDCEKSTKFDVVRNGKWQQALTTALDESGKRPKFTLKDNPTADPMRYLIGARSLEIFCGNGRSLEDGVDDLANDENAVIVDIVNSDGTVEEDKTYRLSGNRDNQDDKVDDVYYNDGGNANEAQDLQCKQLAEMTRDYSAAYGKWVAANQTVDPENEDGGEGGLPANKTTCNIDGIGWMICPVVRTIAVFNDSLFSLLKSLLGINPSMFDTAGGGRATFQSWQAMRDLANVAFVIAFMVIVYSQLTSAGISNYGIKKMLPRIVVAAILVNISFFICAIAVDISNIVGTSLHELLVSQTKAIGGGTGANLGEWDKITSWLIAGGVGSLAVGGAALTVGAYGFLGALALLIPLAITALIAALTVVFVLVARQALVIILIVVSPLAFVAYLLPNTEQWFDRWRKTFFSMLLIYPLVALLFGGSQLASAVIRGGADDALVYVLSLVVLVLPLFATPLLLKFSGGLIGRVAGMMNNPNKGPFDRMKKAGAGYANRKRGFKMEGNIERTTGLRGKTDALRSNTSGGRLRRTGRKMGAGVLGGATWVSGIGNANAKDTEEKNKYAEIASTAAGRNYIAERAYSDAAFAQKLAGGNAGMVPDIQAYSKQAVHEEEVKDVKAQRVLMSHLDVNELMTRMKDTGSTYAERAAATQEIAERGGHQHVQAAYDYLMTEGKAGGENIDKVQEHSAEALLRRKPKGVSATTANSMKSGTMAGDGFMSEFSNRIEIGKFSAQDIASMDVDDHVRIAELAASGKLSDAALQHLSTQLAEIHSSDTMKLSPEQERILTDATYRHPATKPDGSQYTLTPLT